MPGASSTADAGAPPGPLPSTEEVRALAAGLVTPELVVFPVRHHSPGCAWQLRRLFTDNPPSVVLVEGPRSFTSMVSLLTHPEARMPLAIYSYSVSKSGAEATEHRRAAYYPFCDYSPELVALREAQARNIACRFIDLDFSEQCLLESRAGSAEEPVSLLDEGHFGRSRYLQVLADQLGCRDHEELWEHLFEVGAHNLTLSEHVAQVAAYCFLARSEYGEAELKRDGTLAREQEMAWHITQAVAERPEGAGPVLVVLGGFHAVVIPDLLESEIRRPSVSRSSVTRDESALIRYSFERLDRLNGYASGMTSPAWHQLIWDRTLASQKAGHDPSPRRRRDAALKLLFDIAQELRKKHGLSLPMPALAAAYEQVLRLAALRQRPAPVRDDLVDAITSCFVKGDADGDGALILAVTRRTLSGKEMGRVPPGAGTPPLVRDFALRAHRQRLKIDAPERRKVVLDLYRRPPHRTTSRLLHGLAYLGVPFARRTAGPDFVRSIGLDRLQEHWEYSYSVATEAALVEASMYGVTVPMAVANRFAARLDQLDSAGHRDARAAAGTLTEACTLGLHDHLPRVLGSLRAAVGADPDFESVASAAGTLGLLWESREPLEARDVTELPELLRAAYDRATYLGRELRGAPDDGAAAVTGLVRLRELLISDGGRDLDASLYWGTVGSLRVHHELPLIRGAATGLLYAAGRLSDEELASAVEGHFTGLSRAREAVSFLRGLLQTSREAAWQQPSLLNVLDRLFREWDDEAFVAALPELRLAFAEMTPKETDRIAQAVARLHGASGLGPLVRYDLTESDVEANLALSAAVREVLVTDGLGEWLS